MLVVRREATRLLVIVLSALGLVAGTSSAALASCAPSSTYSQAIAGTSGVISYWRLGDPAGSTTACDSVGSNPGTYETGASPGASGAFAGTTSTSFNGTSGYVSVPNSSSLNVGDTFTVEAWVKRGSVSTTGNQVIASKQTGAWALMFNPANQLVLHAGGTNTDLAWSWQRITDTSAWHYVAVTKSGADIHLYIDGNDATGALGTNQTLTDNTLPLLIGDGASGGYFNGDLQEVALYNQALTPAQIANHYQLGSGQAPAVPIGGTGASKGTIPDATPNGGDPVIAAAGDIACGSSDADFNGGAGDANGCQESATAQLINGEIKDLPLSAVLPLGDDQYEQATMSDFTAGYDPTWGAFKSISYPVPGNHEYYTPSALGYFDYFNGQGNVSGIAGNTGAGWYSFNVGAWHVIALNSNCELNSVDEEVIPGGCGAGSPEEQWLEQDLAGDHAACTLAYWHHPLFHSGNEPGGDAMKQMFTDLYNAHATLVLNGHEHQYERFAPQDPNGNLDPTNGIVEFVVGTGGRNLESFGTIAANSVARNNTNYGVLQLTLHPTSYDFQFVPQSGGTFTDSGSGKCRNLKAVDQTRPTSSASSPATTNSSTWKVSYTAADNSGGVGVESVDLYAKAPGQSTYTDVASDNSGSDSGSFTYNASAGDGTYSFYTIATDYAGNVQSTPSSPQATTLLDTVAPQSFAHAPATTSDAAWTVTYTAADNSGGSGLARVDLYARAPGQSSYTNVASNTSGAGSGSFSYTASGGTGTYSFYTLATDKAGNTEAKSSADTVTLLTRAPTTTTVSAPRTGAPGTRIMPGGISAAFSTGSGSPSGAIAFTVFGPQDSPPTSCSSGGTSLGSANVTGNGTYHPSTSFTPTSAGTYWWYAAYTGDGSHSPSDSGCGQGMASTAVSNPTTMRAAGPATAIARLPIPPVSVAAQLSGASAAAGGSITFRVLGPASTPPGSCAGRSLGRTSVHGDGVYHPPSAFTPSRGGTYWWYAAYDGDRTDAPSASTCGRLMATTSVYSVTSVAHSVQSARSARRATSSRFKVDPSTTYLLAVYRESAAGDTIARIESVGIRLSLARASFTHLVTMHHGPRTWEWVYYLRTPPSASGTGALSLSFSKAAATVTILDLLAVDDAGTSAPVIAGGRGMSRADGRGPFVKLPAPPATAGAWLAFLSAGQDEGSSPPLSFPQTRSVFYSHRRLGSAAVYGAMPGAPAEWFRLPASAGWAGIGLALGRQ